MVGDIGGGALYLMTGLLAGVIQARSSGKGCVVDAAIVDGAAHMLNLALSARQRGIVADVRGQSIHDSAPFYETYVCADGEHITIGSIEPQFYALLLQTLGLADDPDFAAPQSQWDKALWPRRRARLQALFITEPRAHWQQVFEGSDVCFGAVLSPLEAAAHPHMQARGVYHAQGGVLQAAPAPRFDGQAYDTPAMCAAGAHTEAVLAQVNAGDGSAAWRR
jgi:alpha-methylacyl-CoA racemase